MSILIQNNIILSIFEIKPQLIMKRIVYLLVLFISFACNKEDNPLTKNGESITVTLNPSTIEVSQGTDVPITKSTTTDTTIYAVQVYENDSAYYYGLFDDPTKMEIALTTNNTYKFKVAAYQKGTGNGIKVSVANGIKSYYLPNAIVLANKFTKGNGLIAINKVSNLKLIGQSSVSDYPEIDAFYCEKSLLVQKGLSAIDIPLKRMGFGVNYNVDGLTSGKLYITMGKDSIVLDKTKTSYQSIRSFFSGNGDFSTFYSKADTLSQSILVTTKWIGDNGTQVSSQGYITFKRNYEKSINISLNTSVLKITFEGWSNTIADIDGNIYHTITIGTQTWLVENLKTTHYRNGDAITLATSNITTSGAYSNPSSDPNLGKLWGRSYNWYAVNDNRLLAPIGWHIPSDTEWRTLAAYLGGIDIAGLKLRELGTSHWTSPNAGATNSSGFTAIPFGGTGDEINFWSSTSYDSQLAWLNVLTYNYNGLSIFAHWKTYYSGIRCIKD